jgi:hypothetical protein
MTDLTTELTTVVDTYLAMWNEPDRATRSELIEQAWVDDGHYVDPLLEATGHAELCDMVDGVRAQFPGSRLRRTTGVDAHHGLIRFGWELGAADGDVVVAGIDVGVVAPDGRLARIGGFFGDPPPVDAA